MVLMPLDMLPHVCCHVHVITSVALQRLLGPTRWVLRTEAVDVLIDNKPNFIQREMLGHRPNLAVSTIDFVVITQYINISLKSPHTILVITLKAYNWFVLPTAFVTTTTCPY